MEGAVAAADQGKQLLAVKVSTIWHLRPIVLDVRIIFDGHDGVIGARILGNTILIFFLDTEYERQGD